jgi:colanic acid/amylovoran biosynthesis glycosyltransferase
VSAPLYLLRYFPTLTETFVNRELEALRMGGVPAEVLRLGARADGALREAPLPAPVREAPRGPGTWRWAIAAPTEGQRFVAAHQRPKDALRYRAALEGLRRSGPPPLVHVHFAGEAAEWAEALRRDLGLPWTLMVHAVDLHKPRPSLPALLAGASAVLSVSDAALPQLHRWGARAARLRCGPELAQWTALDRGPVGSGPLRALFIGRDVPKKGLDTLLTAWPTVLRAAPSASLTLITDRPPPAGPPAPGLRWAGLLPSTGVRAAMAAANLVVLPAQRAPDGDEDGVPLALMEGLAAGRPVISASVGGIAELVDAEVGWLCPPEEPRALAAALIEAAAPAARAGRGAAGPERLRSRGFTLEAQVAGLRAVWRGLGQPWA